MVGARAQSRYRGAATRRVDLAGLGARGTREDPLDTTIAIETPEHITFRYELAGPSRRAIAYVLDLLVRALVVSVFAIFLGLSGESGWKTSVLLILLFLLEWGYFVLCEALMGGRSFGKRAMDLRVVTLDGSPIAFGDSVLRNLLRAADFLPSGYVFGLLSMICDARFRRLGDLAAGTMVVYERRQRLREPIRIEPLPTPQELARLPDKILLTSETLLALELFLRRAPSLGRDREQELAELLAKPYAALLGVKYKDPSRLLALVYHVATGAVRAG